MEPNRTTNATMSQLARNSKGAKGAHSALYGKLRRQNSITMLVILVMHTYYKSLRVEMEGILEAVERQVLLVGTTV